MIRAGTVAWFARHEIRLAWRDWAWLLSGGRRRRGYTVALGLVAFVLLMHGLAYLTLPRAADLVAPPDKRALVAVGGTLALYWSLMLSQAMEAVTRAFYARGDLDLVLSSPAAAARLFAVRIGAMAASIAGMSLVLAAPAIDVLAWRGGAQWLAAYGVVAALAMAAVTISTVVTNLLFAAIGPKRTRLGRLEDQQVDDLLGPGGADLGRRGDDHVALARFVASPLTAVANPIPHDLRWRATEQCKSPLAMTPIGGPDRYRAPIGSCAIHAPGRN